jgi:acetyl esterase/lipase
MTSKHLVDPELLPGLDLLPDFTFSTETLPLVREAMANLRRPQVSPDDPELILTQQDIIVGDGAAITLLITRPAEKPDGLRPAILHIHGGGYIIGSADMFAAGCADLAKAMDALIVSVDYRLAPETPHPGPVEDCYAALAWLHDNAADLGIDPARVAVTGESAGGGLAAALTLLARDRGRYPLCHQHLIYPMLDDRTCTGRAHPHTGEFVWTGASNHFGWSCLLGHAPGLPDVSPYAAAARAQNLAGLPSTYIAVGALDLFLNEDMDYALRLTEAGVPTELHVYPGAYHGFDMNVEADVAKLAKVNSHRALKRALDR